MLPTFQFLLRIPQSQISLLLIWRRGFQFLLRIPQHLLQCKKCRRFNLSIPSSDSTKFMVVPSMRLLNIFQVLLRIPLVAKPTKSVNSMYSFQFLLRIPLIARVCDSCVEAEAFNSFFGFHPQLSFQKGCFRESSFQFLLRIPQYLSRRDEYGIKINFQFLLRIPQAHKLISISLNPLPFQFLLRIPRRDVARNGCDSVIFQFLLRIPLLVPLSVPRRE